MNPRRIAALASFLILAGWTAHARAATPAPVPDPAPLDQKRVHADYNDGNFDKVIASIDQFTATHKSYSLADSIFIAKHLAVVYSANPQTLEKGKYYMMRLLAMLPSAKLVDMFVSDEIDRIFDKVREEFLSRQRSFGVDTAKVSVPSKSPSRDAREAAAPAAPAPRQAEAKPKPKDESTKAVFLVAGGTALVALGVAAYFMLGDEQTKTTEKTYVVP